jgi:hypothetical protein
MTTFQPVQKVINALEIFLESSKFQKDIYELRKEIDMPPDGLPFPNREEIVNEKNLFYFPKEFVTKEGARKVILKMRKITKAFPIHNLEVDLGFKIYFYHHLYEKEVFASGLWLNNVCKLVEARNEFLEYCGDILLEEYKNKIENFYLLYPEHQDELTSTYPIALYIHPNASQRDVVQYVRSTWPVFEYYRKQFKNKNSLIGKVKTKRESIKKRNEFIYKHKHLPRKEIMKQLVDHFGADQAIDYAYIGKIISLETKRRKNM